jgi:hypothetical protein
VRHRLARRDCTTPGSVLPLSRHNSLRWQRLHRPSEQVDYTRRRVLVTGCGAGRGGKRGRFGSPPYALLAKVPRFLLPVIGEICEQKEKIRSGCESDRRYGCDRSPVQGKDGTSECDKVAETFLGLSTFYFHNVNPTEIYSRLHGRPASSQPAAGQTAQLTGLCVQFSSITAGLCAVLGPDSDSWANFGSRTVLAGLHCAKITIILSRVCCCTAVWYEYSTRGTL